MAKLNFRDLKAEEIDCRIATINEKGMTLLLYKDARCDMNILDETVGSYNWQRLHSRDNANCTVQIWDEDKKQWISKEDVGTESNTEAVKGLASDSFKRACFNWGIGRELYSAPFIWLPADKCSINKNDKGKFVSYDKFSVKDITIKDKKITGLSIYSETKKTIVYTFGKVSKSGKTTDQPKVEEPKIEQPVMKQPEPAQEVNDPIKETKQAYWNLINYCTQHGLDVKKACADNNLSKSSTKDDFVKALEKITAETEYPDDYGKLPFEV